MVRVIGALVVIALMVYALSDVSGSDERRRGGIPTVVWGILIVLLPLFGPLAWIVFSRYHDRTTRQAAGPLAPDDDPDFLRKLDQDRHRRSDAQPEGAPSPEPSPETGQPTGEATPERPQDDRPE